MIKKKNLIIIGICILAIVGLTIFSFVTGNVVNEPNPEIVDEYFRIDNFGSELNEEVNINGTQNNSGS